MEYIKNIILKYPVLSFLVGLPVIIVILIRLNVLPIQFGSDYGFEEYQCINTQASDISLLITCRKEVLLDY
jgi:hypothetical protein